MNIPGRPSLWMRAAYFAFYSGIACWGTYIILYYQRLGLTGTEIGILNAVGPLGMAFFSPIWGYVADSRSAHRLILRTALLTTAVVALLIIGASSFWQILPLVILLAIVGTTASPLLDSYGVTISSNAGISFGQIRVWGSIGYTVVVWLIGYAMGGEVSRLFLFGYAVTLSTTFIATLGLPAREKKRGQSRWQGATAMLRRADMRVVLLTVFLLSSATNPIFSFFGIYIQALGGGTSMLGLTSAVAAISEFPVMFLGGVLTYRLGSRRMFIVALVIYCVRLMLYSIVPSASWVLPVQILHGFSFGIYLMASVTLVHEFVGSELAATAQGLLASAMAFGQMTGSIVGGILLDMIGIFMIYRLSIMTTLLALVVFVLGMRWYGNDGAPVVRMIPDRRGA
jgi:MFS transporter, PPP family, 3-phenylpropionic acid transporter